MQFTNRWLVRKLENWCKELVEANQAVVIHDSTQHSKMSTRVYQAYSIRVDNAKERVSVFVSDRYEVKFWHDTRDGNDLAGVELTDIAFDMLIHSHMVVDIMKEWGILNGKKNIDTEAIAQLYAKLSEPEK